MLRCFAGCQVQGHRLIVRFLVVLLLACSCRAFNVYAYANDGCCIPFSSNQTRQILRISPLDGSITVMWNETASRFSWDSTINRVSTRAGRSLLFPVSMNFSDASQAYLLSWKEGIGAPKVLPIPIPTVQPSKNPYVSGATMVRPDQVHAMTYDAITDEVSILICPNVAGNETHILRGNVMRGDYKVLPFDSTVQLYTGYLGCQYASPGSDSMMELIVVSNSSLCFIGQDYSFFSINMTSKDGDIVLQNVQINQNDLADIGGIFATNISTILDGYAFPKYYLVTSSTIYLVDPVHTDFQMLTTTPENYFTPVVYDEVAQQIVCMSSSGVHTYDILSNKWTAVPWGKSAGNLCWVNQDSDGCFTPLKWTGW
jgi:hypothetical protein